MGCVAAPTPSFFRRTAHPLHVRLHHKRGVVMAWRGVQTDGPIEAEAVLTDKLSQLQQRYGCVRVP